MGIFGRKTLKVALISDAGRFSRVISPQEVSASGVAVHVTSALRNNPTLAETHEFRAILTPQPESAGQRIVAVGGWNATVAEVNDRDLWEASLYWRSRGRSNGVMCPARVTWTDRAPDGQLSGVVVSLDVPRDVQVARLGPANLTIEEVQA